MTSDERPQTAATRQRALLAAWVLLAFFLRAHRLAGQSLWSDEDITLDRVRRPLTELLASLPVEHGPAYFVVVRLWTRLAGTSDLALRAPSLFLGVLAVPLAGYLGARLVGRRAGWIAALIAAVNPFLVWYGQEARMYAMTAALALAAAAAALRARRNGGWWWPATGLAAAAAVHTHYYGALIVFVLCAWAAIDARSGGRSLRGWATAGGVAALAFLPWAPRALGLLSFPGWREPVPVARAPWLNLSAWSAGPTADGAVALWVTWAYLALAAVGLAHLLARARSGPRAGGARRALLYALVPLAVAAALVIRQPDFHPRYFLAVVPAYYLLVATGAAALPGPSFAAGAGLLALAAVPPLHALYTDPAVQKQDYRAVIATVEDRSGPDGAALLLDGPPFGMMERYRSEDSSVKIVNLQSRALGDLPDPRLFQEVDARVAPYDDVWLAEDGDAAGAARRWLEARFETVYPVEGIGLQDVTLSRHYRLRASDSRRTARAEPVGAGAPLALTVTAPVEVAAGGVLAADLAWPDRSGDGRVVEDRKVSVRLVGPGGRRAAAADRRIESGSLVRQGLFVPVDAAAGPHALEVVLYDPETLAAVATWRWTESVRVKEAGAATGKAGEGGPGARP